jgi:hypothetical protein
MAPKVSVPPWGDFDGMTDGQHFLFNCCGKSRRDGLVLGAVNGAPATLYTPSSKDEGTLVWVRKNELQVTEDGGLVAWRSARVKRGSGWLDTFDEDEAYRVLILDLRRHRLLAQTPWVPTPKVIYDYALSPDGKFLAVMTDEWITMYRVPSADAGPAVKAGSGG